MDRHNSICYFLSILHFVILFLSISCFHWHSYLFTLYLYSETSVISTLRCFQDSHISIPYEETGLVL
ncbi:hypothetical protein L873DRAFT_893079 [Choiromyces venosus 120613-1]|uniref:Uncharacterized protein n=1 Tax=Choiromyces venosus 120613-1 TaxID=1336337 RepID=A0A3N4JMX6_9PEZI|nr:hypothetical protein L873DRAFT_893079 [Choiromyces venosus 120613-1]